MTAYPEATEETSGESEQAETCEVPSSLIGDAQPGDTVTIKVVSIGDGTATVTSAAEAEPKQPEGSDAMASEFDQPQPA